MNARQRRRLAQQASHMVPRWFEGDAWQYVLVLDKLADSTLRTRDRWEWRKGVTWREEADEIRSVLRDREDD